MIRLAPLGQLAECLRKAGFVASRRDRPWAELKGDKSELSTLTDTIRCSMTPMDGRQYCVLLRGVLIAQTPVEWAVELNAVNT